MGVLNNLISVTKFSYCKKSDISYVLENRHDGTAVVGFLGEADWTEVSLTVSESNFSEEQKKDNDAGVYYIQKFTGDVPVDELDLPGGISALTDEPVIVRLELANGYILLVGNTTNFVEVEYNMNAAEQRYNIQFTRESETPSLFVE